MKLSINQITFLSNCEPYTLRCEAARQSNSPLSVLEKLADDVNYHVRISVGANSNTPLKILHKLYKDFDFRVRQAVAMNPNCSRSILEKLIDDVDYDVSLIAKSHILTLTAVLTALKKRYDDSL